MAEAELNFCFWALFNDIVIFGFLNISLNIVAQDFSIRIIGRLLMGQVAGICPAEDQVYSLVGKFY